MSALFATPGEGRETRNVILVTADGLRHQELFSGVDPLLLESPRQSGIETPETLRAAFWRDTAQERREALLPFFWGTLAPRGVVLGNVAGGSSVRVTNRQRISYPGYAEILTGQAQEAVTSNDPIRIPRETILEFVRRKLDLPPRGVAAFASWSVFSSITAHTPGAILCNAGYEAMPRDVLTADMRSLEQLQGWILTPWDTVRHDAFTLRLALEYLETYRPRFLYVALDETDDWAHDRRYDRTIQGVELFDRALRDLWQTLDYLDGYRDHTTLVITTDHGRGRTIEDWTSHGSDVPGSDEIWLAVVGPDTPDRGELAPSASLRQDQIAATVLRLLGLDPQEFNPVAGEPIPAAFEEIHPNPGR